MVSNLEMKSTEIIYNYLSKKFDLISYMNNDPNFDYSELTCVEQKLKNPGVLMFKRGEKVEKNYCSEPINFDLKQYSEYLTLKENPQFESDPIKRNFSNNVFRFYKEKLSDNDLGNNNQFNYEYFLNINDKYYQYYSKFYHKEELNIFNSYYIYLNIVKYLFTLYYRNRENKFYDFCEYVNYDTKMMILYVYVNCNMKNKCIEKYIFSDIVCIFKHKKNLSKEKKNNLNVLLLTLCCIYSRFYLFENMINLNEEDFNYSFDQSADYLFDFFEGNVPKSFFCDKKLIRYFFVNSSFHEFLYKFSYRSNRMMNSMENCYNLIQKDKSFYINAKIYDFFFTPEKEKRLLSGLNKNLQKIIEIYFETSLNKPAIIFTETSVKISSFVKHFDNYYFLINFSRNSENNFSTNILIPENKRESFYSIIDLYLSFIFYFVPLFIFNRKQKLNTQAKHLPPFFFNILVPSSIDKVNYYLKHYFDSNKIVFSVKFDHNLMNEQTPILVYHLNNIRSCFKDQSYTDDLRLHFILKVTLNTKGVANKARAKEILNSLSYLDELILPELLVLKFKVKITKLTGFIPLETLFYKLKTLNFSKTNLKFLEIKIKIHNTWKFSLLIQNNKEECILSLINQNNNEKLTLMQNKFFYYMVNLIQRSFAPKILSYNFPFEENFEITREIGKLSTFGQKISLNFLYKIKKLEFIKNLYVRYKIRFYELEITYILLNDVEKILKTLEICKVEKVSLVCSEGHINSLNKIEKIFALIFSSTSFKTIKLKILYQRNKFDTEHMIEFFKRLCSKYYNFKKLFEINIIRGNIDALSIPFQNENKKYFNNLILTMSDEIDFKFTENHLANKKSFIYKDVFPLLYTMEKNVIMKKLKRFSIKRIMADFLQNEVGLSVRFYKIEYK